MLSVILVYLASGQSSNQGTVAAIEAQIKALREQHAQKLEALLESSYTSEGLTTQAAAPIGSRDNDQATTSSGVRIKLKASGDNENLTLTGLGQYTSELGQAVFYRNPLVDSHEKEAFGKWLVANGVKKGKRNVYMVIGSATSGFDPAQSVDVHTELKEWCDTNDVANPKGWLVISQGDNAYAVPSIVELFEVIGRPKPHGCGATVVVIQSESSRAGAWGGLPFYAEALFFGHGTDDCYGGWCKGPGLGPKEKLAFPDEAMFGYKHGGPLLPDGLRLVDVLGGIFQAGGGDITWDQATIYGGDAGNYGDVPRGPTPGIRPTPYGPLTEALEQETKDAQKDAVLALKDKLPADASEEAKQQLYEALQDLAAAIDRDDQVESRFLRTDVGARATYAQDVPYINVLKKLSKLEGAAALAAWNAGYQAVFG